MAPPPHPNPSPPTARPEAASKPDLTSAEGDGRAGSSTSSTLKLRPPPKPGPSAPQTETETETAGTERSAVPSPSMGASSARDQPNTSGEAAALPLDRQQKWRPPYEIPKWSAAPSQHYFLEVIKDGAIIEKIDVSRKGAYMFGRSELCDTVLMHSSISRYHAVLQFKCDGSIFLYDIGSVHGSFINDSLIKKNSYKDIHVGDVIRFGESSRLYIFRGPSELIPPMKKPANGDNIQGSHKAERIQEDTLSNSSMEHVKNQMRGGNTELVVSNANSAGFSTPQNKSSSSDIERNAFSVGAKRSNVSMDYAKTLRCKRLLFHDSRSSRSVVTLAEYATYGLTERIKVPFMSKKVRMGKEALKLVLLNTFGLFLDLHRKNSTLKGSYSLENFLVCPSTKQVTLCGMEPEQYCSGDGALDKSHFVGMVKAMFRVDLPVPADITVWLNCIEDGTNDSVLRKHINMRHPDAIFGEFCIMYHGMLELRDLDMERFLKVLKKLRQYGTWEQDPFTWCILQDNTRYHDPKHTESVSTFRSSAFGLMQQYRNCWQHPAKLHKKYLLAIIMCDHPNLLSDVQAVLYALGCLPHLDM